MTAPASHYINKMGRPVPVRILETGSYAGRPSTRVEAVTGAPFQTWTHGGWAASAVAEYPPACVHPLPEAEPARECEADAELTYGLALRDLAVEWTPEKAELAEDARVAWKRSEARFAEVEG